MPINDWMATWFMVRQKGLGPDLTSISFKILHRILPTASRLNRILPNSSPFCSRCIRENKETLEHALVDCSANGGVGHALLALVTHYTDFPMSTTDLITFNIDGTSNSLTFCLIWIVATIFSAIWSKRCEKKKLSKLEAQAEVDAHLKFFNKTKMVNEKTLLQDITNFLNTL